jgi:tetratricopeptide (TPR) repeat protein
MNEIDKLTESYKDLISRGYRLYSAGKFQDAIRYLELGADFDNPKIQSASLAILSVGYFKNGNFIKSFNLLHKVLTKYPSNDLIFEGFMDTFIIKKIYDKIVKSRNIEKNVFLEIEKDFKENDLPTNITLSFIRYLEDDFNGMEICLKRAQAISPDNHYLLFCLAVCYGFQGRYRDTIFLCEQFSDIKRYSSLLPYCNLLKEFAYVFLSFDCLQKGESEDAQRALEESVQFINTVLAHQLKSKSLGIFERFNKLFLEIVRFDIEFWKILRNNEPVGLYHLALSAYDFFWTLPLLSKSLASIKKAKDKNPIIAPLFDIALMQFSFVYTLLNTLIIKFPSRFSGVTKLKPLRITIDFDNSIRNCETLFSHYGLETKPLHVLKDFISEIQNRDTDKILSTESVFTKLIKGESIPIANQSYLVGILASIMKNDQDLETIKVGVIKILKNQEDEKKHWEVEIPVWGDITKLIQKWRQRLLVLKKKNIGLFIIAVLLTSPVVLISVIVILIKGIPGLFNLIKNLFHF